MQQGWISVHRKLLDNPIVCKDTEHFTVWMYLLLSATHKEIDAFFKGERIILKPGQLITGRKSISEKFKISESKVQRILKCFENEHQIEQQTSNKNRLISVINWEFYQEYGQQTEQPVNSNRTTVEQPLNTNNNVIMEQCNNGNKRVRNFVPPSLEDVRSYCSERKNSIDPEKFIDFYSSKGWMIGKNKMKNWQAAIRTWEQREKKEMTGGKIHEESTVQNRRPASDFYKDLLGDWENN